MTEHSHSTHVEGCYRCELGRDEVVGLINTTEREYKAFNNGWERGQEDLRFVLEDLQQRMQRAIAEFEGLLLTVSAKSQDATRLNGKAQGMRLALSCVEEELRG